MKILSRSVKLLAGVALLVGITIGLYIAASHLSLSRAGGGAVPSATASPSKLPPPGPGGVLAQAAQVDTTWVRQTFSGYSRVSAPVQTSYGWTFTLTSSGDIYSPSTRDLCTSSDLNNSSYTKKSYGHLVKVDVGRPTQSSGSTFTVLTRPVSTSKGLLKCS